MFRLKNILFLFTFIILQQVGQAQDDFKYQTPPKDILDLVLAKPTPGVNIDDRAEWMLLTERSDYPTMKNWLNPNTGLPDCASTPIISVPPVQVLQQIFS